MSLEELYKQKIEAEKAYFQHLLKEEESKEKKRSFLDKVKENSSLLITLASAIAAIWGFILPIHTYITETNNALKYQLNSQMIEIIGDLDTNRSNQSEKAILLLSYYESNSLPILFHELGSVKKKKQSELFNIIKESISTIYFRNSSTRKDCLAEIEKSMRSSLVWARSFKEEPNGEIKNNLKNLVNLISSIKEKEKNPDPLNKILAEMRKDLVKLNQSKTYNKLIEEIDKALAQ